MLLTICLMTLICFLFQYILGVIESFLGGVYEQGQQEAIATQDVIDRIVENAEKCLSGKL
jgi:hypothetical protein